MSEKTRKRGRKDDVAQLGDAIYESKIKPRHEAKDKDKYAAIDVRSGEYEIDSDSLTACDRLNARVPQPEVWLVRIGSRYLTRFGYHQPKSR